MQTVALPSGTIEYEVHGPEDSPHAPILFVHGVVADHRLWAPVAELLAEAGYRSYAPTLPLGSHRIPWGPDHDRSAHGAASLIAEFVDEFGLSDSTLVGNDTGGAICQFALDADPALVARAVFTNCDCFDRFPPQPFPIAFALLQRPAVTRALVAGPMQARLVRHSPLGYGLLVTGADPELTRDLLEPLRTDPRIRDDLAAFLRSLDAAELSAITPRLARLTMPVSIVWGTADRAFRPALGRRLANVIEQATFTEVPGSRTFVALDRPEALVDAIVEIGGRPVPVR